MAYEHREGQGSLFKNGKKEKESHPDYRGDAMTLPDHSTLSKPLMPPCRWQGMPPGSLFLASV